MARNKLHYRAMEGSEYSLCSMYLPAFTRTKSRVTCTRCRKHLGLPVETKPKVPKPAPTFDFEVTDDVRKALKYVGKTMGVWAERTGQCDTYDTGIAYLNTKMPEGVKVPGRYADWKIKIENKDGESIHTVLNAVNGKAALDSLRWAISRAGGGLEKTTITLIGEVE